LAETLGAKIDVLHVVHGGEHDRVERTEDLRQRFRESLEGLVPRHAEEFCQASAFVEFGSAHQRILEHIKEHGIDLLVLGIRKTPHLGLEMRTSAAFQLPTAATCPVLTVTA
jgi:nucleotide-binding universal stress UspA family protein